MDRRQLLLASVTVSVGLYGLLGMAEDAQASDKKSGGGKDTYLTMPPATGVIPRRDGRRSTLTVEMGLDVPNEELRARAELSRPRLNAALNEVVRTTARSLLPGRVPDLESLTRSLQSATDRVLGRQGAKILLGSVVVL